MVRTSPSALRRTSALSTPAPVNPGAAQDIPEDKHRLTCIGRLYVVLQPRRDCRHMPMTNSAMTNSAMTNSGINTPKD